MIVPLPSDPNTGSNPGEGRVQKKIGGVESVVYFNQRLGAAHSKCQSKSSFLHYSRRKA